MWPWLLTCWPGNDTQHIIPSWVLFLPHVNTIHENYPVYSRYLSCRVREISVCTINVLVILVRWNQRVNWLAPRKFKWYFRYLIFHIITENDGWGISCELALRWMSLDLTDDKSTLVQVMAWCLQATSHYLSQCWLRSMLPNGVTGPQWVNLELPLFSGPLCTLTCTMALCHVTPPVVLWALLTSVGTDGWVISALILCTLWERYLLQSR